MFKDEETRKFLMYGASTGILIIFMACTLQLCFVPGSECKIPFISVDDTDVLIYEEPPKFILKEGAQYQANVETSKGSFVIDLYEDNAPDTVNNFVFLASKGYYDGVLFHRLFPDLLIQTGDRNTLDGDSSNDGLGGPGYVFDDEINWQTAGIPSKQQLILEEEGYISNSKLISKKFRTYSVAMANSGQPNTNGSQFFVVMADELDTKIASLRGRHTVFGRVVAGFEVIDEMNEVEVVNPDSDFPTPHRELVVEKIEILETVPDSLQDESVDNGDDQTVKFN